MTDDRESFAARAAAPGVELRPLPEPEDVTDEQWTELHAYVQDRFRESPDAADGGGELPCKVFRVQITQPWMLYEAVEDGGRPCARRTRACPRSTRRTWKATNRSSRRADRWVSCATPATSTCSSR
jgi:hypothetical protein